MITTLAFTLLASSILAANLTGAQETQTDERASPEDTPALTYRLASGSESWDPAIRQRVVDAMDAAVALYNELGHFPKRITANYDSSVPTANANYDGWITFGGQIGTRVALHEISHTLGIGTHPKWRQFTNDGHWTGEHALKQVREFDGVATTLSADRHHFWPYGLNFDREASDENNRRHVIMVAAFRRDLGIEESEAQLPSGRTASPMGTSP